MLEILLGYIYGDLVSFFNIFSYFEFYRYISYLFHQEVINWDSPFSHFAEKIISPH